MNPMRSCAVLLAALAAVAAPSAPAADATTNASPLVYTIPIRGPIEPALTYVIRRGVSEADAAGAAAVVFVMDTPGGEVQSAEDIIDIVRRIRVPTYTFVERNAFSAGALIALSTKRIYMAPGAVIGDALPIMMLPLVGVQGMPPEIQEKMVAGVAVLARAAAEQGGHNPEVAEAMVRREMEFKIGDEVLKPAGRLLALTDREALRPAGAGGKPLLSSGTVSNLTAMLDAAGFAHAEVRELKVTTAERLARWIKLLGGVLLVAGAIGLYIEFKTPGFGFPGLFGILCLGLFFWGHHIAGLAGYEDLLLFLAGLVLILVELFILPGFGIAGVLGIALMGAGLLLAMVWRAPGGPWLPAMTDLRGPMMTMFGSLVATLVIGALLARWLPRSEVFGRFVLKAATARTEGFAAAPTDATLIGASGEAASDLRPAGAAWLLGRRIDVVTRGDYIRRGTPVRVAEVLGSRVVVEPVDPPA